MPVYSLGLVDVQALQQTRGGSRPPLKLEKNMNFWRKIVIFHTKYPNNFRASAIGKKLIFWRKIVIFHTKYPKHFRASLHSAQFA
jgi:hypothetical protein